jgi:hypothetical protein
MFKVHTTVVDAGQGEIIWYRRNGDPGKLEESFKLSGNHYPADKNDGGLIFEQ